MLYDVELQSWCNSLRLSQQQRDLVNQIRTSPPARKVKAGGRNVHGPYASSKMGRTIQFESHTVELPAITQFYEYDDQVLEYWDQPIKFSIKCSPQGKQATTIGHYPDFFVMRKDCCGFEEWKTEKRLEKLSEEQPYRYQKIERQWVDVIVQEYIENLGYYYRLRSDSEIDWVKYRNQKYLQPYKQGYLNQQYILNEQVEVNLQEIIVNYPGINLTNLLEKAKNATIDDINTLIALEKVYVNLSEVALVEQEKVHLFRDQTTAEAYITATHDYCEPVSSNVSIVDLKVGSSFLLDGKSLTIDHIGESKIIFRGEQGIIRWTYAEFQQLIELGEISNLQTENHTTLDEEGWQYFLESSPKALETANYRYAAIKPFLGKEPYISQKCELSERTLRDWKAKYRQAQQKYGCGFIGLIPQYKGNPTPRYSDEDLEFIDKVIEEQYETSKQKNVWQTYEFLRDKWQESGRISPLPSHTFYYERVKKRNSYEQTKKRMGSRAANNLLGPWLIRPTTPRHGDRPFEIVHIDHTKLDVECICPYSGKNLGRPWVTGMIDAYSRRILALYLTFDNPSYRSCMMAIRICVQRFGRFPEWIVVDNGKEFCLIHKQRLIEECLHCGSRLPVMARLSPAGFCSRCYGWLGQEIKGEEEIEKYKVNILGISELIALTPKLGYKPIPIELTRKLQLILLVFEQAIGKDVKLLGDLGGIMESLRIASTRNQSQPYHLVKLIIPVCEKAKISVSQLFGSDFKELGKILFGNFSLELKL